MNRLRLLFCLLVVVLALCVPILAEESVYDKPVTCTFKDLDFPAIIAGLAKQTGVEILVDPAIQSKLTFDLGQVTLGQALERLCLLVNAFPGRIGEKLVIATGDPKGPLFWAIMETELIPVRYYDVKQMMQFLAKNIIAQYLIADEASNSLSISAPRAMIDYAKALIFSLDKAKLQIGYEVTVFDRSKITLKDKGAEFQWAQGPANPNGLWEFSFANSVFGARDTRNGEKLFNLFNYNSKDRLKLLAQTRVVIQDGETGSLNFCRTYYATIGSVLGGIAKIETIRAGVTLKVTARAILNDQGLYEIFSTVDADISDVVGMISGLPVTTNRTVQEVLCGLDGETIIVGGLWTNSDYWRKDKTPLLGDIPLIGNLFRTTHKDQRRQEVIILVTPRIIRPGQTTDEAKRIKSQIEKELKPTIMPGMSGSSAPGAGGAIN